MDVRAAATTLTGAAGRGGACGGPEEKWTAMKEDRGLAMIDGPSEGANSAGFFPPSPPSLRLCLLPSYTVGARAEGARARLATAKSDGVVETT